MPLRFHLLRDPRGYMSNVLREMARVVFVSDLDAMAKRATWRVYSLAEPFSKDVDKAVRTSVWKMRWLASSARGRVSGSLLGDALGARPSVCEVGAGSQDFAAIFSTQRLTLVSGAPSKNDASHTRPTLRRCGGHRRSFK